MIVIINFPNEIKYLPTHVKNHEAAVLHGAKDIRLQDFKIPDVLPGMVLLKVQRVGICGSGLPYFQDGYCDSFTPSKPFIPGLELTGEIVKWSIKIDTSFPD